MITISVNRIFWCWFIWALIWYIVGRVTGIRYAEDKAESKVVNDLTERVNSLEKVRDLKIANYELQTALSLMLCAWDHCSDKLTMFLKDHTAEAAEAYTDAMPNLFYAASIGRRAIREHKNASSSHCENSTTDRA